MWDEIVTKILPEGNERECAIVALTLDYVSKNPDWAKGDKNPLPKALDALDCTLRTLYGLDIDDIKTKSREARFVFCRQMSMYVLRLHTNLSYPEISRIFGQRHPSALVAMRIIDNYMLYDVKRAKEIMRFKETYKSYYNGED